MPLQAPGGRWSSTTAGPAGTRPTSIREDRSMPHDTAATTTISTTVATRGRAIAVRLSGDSGQGTVEYVALLLLVAAILTAVVTQTHGHFDIGNTIGNKLKDVIATVGASKK